MVKSLTYKKTIKILEKHGFVLKRQKGSHVIYKNTEAGTMVCIPMHGKNKPIKIGTFKSIIKHSGIDETEFR